MKKSILIIMAMGMLIGQVDYASQIQTVIDANCTNSGCHTDGGGYQNGLDLSSYSNLMAGDSENGPVVILWITPIVYYGKRLTQVQCLRETILI